MKRTALKRKTPMKRGSRRMKRTPLRQQSPKCRKENAEYSRLRVEFLTAHPLCEACLILHPRRKQAAASTDVHHMQGRGKNLNRVETWLATDRQCHNEIHSNPNRARKLGLLK